MFPAKLMGGLALATALLAAPHASAEKLRTHFDTDSAGRAPGFFDLVVWGAPGNADWIVLGDVNPPSTPNKLIQTIGNRPAGSMAIALRRKYEFRDGEVSVGLRRGGGQSGIALRASGEKDFLLVLVDGTSGEARATSWVDGKATDLARGKAVIDHEWGTLKIKASGPSIEAFWNGKPLLTATDPHPMAGRVGLATAGPGQASFDELVFDVAASAP